MSKTMTAYEVVSGAAGQVRALINERWYNFAQVISLEAKAEKTKTEVPILGRRSRANKTTGLKLTGSATLHYNTSILREMLYEYKTTGKDVYFEIHVTNEDETTGLGRQTTQLYGVNLNSVVLAKIDASSDDYLSEDVEFTFEDFEMSDKFKLMEAMNG